MRLWWIRQQVTNITVNLKYNKAKNQKKLTLAMENFYQGHIQIGCHILQGIDESETLVFAQAQILQANICLEREMNGKEYLPIENLN